MTCCTRGAWNPGAATWSRSRSSGARRRAPLAWHAGAGHLPPSIGVELTTQQGETHRLSFKSDDLATLRREADGGADASLVKAIPLPRLPWGYHTLRLEAGGRRPRR